ncbi:uncharacterized protein LOC128391045 [Panonychus citri]|uniref:uncharacterized protein LOC128391045 n=1 Tax=Panonychus citri TaxID=50023 RepID=UPI0023073A6D|nr:uncharacterized protein LOC128391045 [Panonychus citri]
MSEHNNNNNNESDTDYVGLVNEIKEIVFNNLTQAGRKKYNEKLRVDFDRLVNLIEKGQRKHETEDMILKRLDEIEKKIENKPGPGGTSGGDNLTVGGGGINSLDGFLNDNYLSPSLVEITSSNSSHHHHGKLFHGSHLLTGSNSHFQKVLNSWYGVSKQTWRCIYRAHTHGFSADSFHHHCDNISPTFTLILGHNGDICGGFTDVPWSIPADPKGRYITSEKSFLFSLINRESTDPIKFDVIKKRFAIVHHQRYGPIFGGGADLAISDKCNSNMESYSNLPHSFDGEHANNYILMGDYHFCVKDYEVFTLSSK